MRRSLIAVVATLSVLTVACGGGDKKAPSPNPAAPTERAAATPAAGKTTPTATKKTATAKPSTKSEKTIGGLFGSIFNGALNGPPAVPATGIEAGDPELLKLLPPNSALPDGYTPVGSYTFRAPDGISDTGGIDIAAEMAVVGGPPASSTDTPDLSKVGVLMALVMKPDDLQSLGDAFDSISGLDQQALEDALAGDSEIGNLIKIQNTRTFETDGLGEGNAGIEMTIDLSAFGSLISGFAADAGTDPHAADLSNLKLTMRLYLFARGDYAGGLLRMAFQDALPNDIDEVGLTKLIDDKLKSAP